MSLAIEKSPLFQADVTQQFGWYLEKAGVDVAWRFFEATDATLHKLSHHPDLGRRRNFKHPLLQGLQSFRVTPPFDKLLVFFRVKPGALEAWRLMHGARNLPQRLAQPPEET